MSLHLNTPVIESQPLMHASGRSILLKMDALQPTGSFKLRGVGFACEYHAARGKRRFVSSSGGNAGIAVAYAGRKLSIPVSVFVPETTTETAKALIREQDADVIVHGASWQDANEMALSALGEDAAFIHPFDDPLSWNGHATLVDEVARLGVAFDAVVVAVGGGGLLSGVAGGLARNGFDHVSIIAVETEGAASLARSIAAGRQIELHAITSIATSLGARRVCERAFDLARGSTVRSVVVDDLAAVYASLRFLDDHRVLVEPACGAALAPVYGSHEALADFRSVLVVVCGGATASVDRLLTWRNTLG